MHYSSLHLENYFLNCTNCIKDPRGHPYPRAGNNSRKTETEALTYNGIEVSVDSFKTSAQPLKKVFLGVCGGNRMAIFARKAKRRQKGEEDKQSRAAPQCCSCYEGGRDS